MRVRLLFPFVITLLSLSAGAKEHANSPQRIGDLVLTLVALEDRGNPQPDTHHIVAVRLRAKNVGKVALCVAFNPILKATFALEYSESDSPYPDRLQIRELLPGEETEGEYDFLVKTGAAPVQFVLKRTSESQTCERGKDSLSSIWHGSEEVKFDLLRAAGEITPLESGASSKAGIEIFLPARTNRSEEVKVIKALQEHCPQIQVTTDKSKANYVVDLTPSSLTRSKNAVVVTNMVGDIIYSGATYNLGNAAKDACSAILKNSDTERSDATNNRGHR